MSRDPGLFLEDILEACSRIQRLKAGMDRIRFGEDWRDRDAILHNLEVVGEAVKRLPEELKTTMPSVPWKRIAGFRDVLAHGYFALDDAIVWDVVVHEIDPLAEAIHRLLQDLGRNPGS